MKISRESCNKFVLRILRACRPKKFHCNLSEVNGMKMSNLKMVSTIALFFKISNLIGV